MIGLGLVEAIAPEDILANADPEDANQDGVSGRARLVWSEFKQKKLLGRFGWKASQATIADQTSAAFLNDMGLSTSLEPQPWGDCTVKQVLCRKAIHGNHGAPKAPEMSDQVASLIHFYSANLAVPARRGVADPRVLSGKQIFFDIGCTSCHTPKFTTGQATKDLAHLSEQQIWPYSDFLLHDMGEGLSDRFPERGAQAGEWRTPPLWGIGLTKTVSEQARYLHDGRAETLQEAILWHGGEGQRARDHYRGLSPSQRAALLEFLSSL